MYISPSDQKKMSTAVHCEKALMPLPMQIFKDQEGMVRTTLNLMHIVCLSVASISMYSTLSKIAIFNIVARSKIQYSIDLTDK